MTEKIYKPKTCEQCPVVKHEKGMIVCGVMKNLKAKANDTNEKTQMWKNCHIAWDRE
jgi:hypothetical protein